MEIQWIEMLTVFPLFPGLSDWRYTPSKIEYLAASSLDFGHLVEIRGYLDFNANVSREKNNRFFHVLALIVKNLAVFYFGLDGEPWHICLFSACICPITERDMEENLVCSNPFFCQWPTEGEGYTTYLPSYLGVKSPRPRILSKSHFNEIILYYAFKNLYSLALEVN